MASHVRSGYRVALTGLVLMVASQTLQFFKQHPATDYADGCGFFWGPVSGGNRDVTMNVLANTNTLGDISNTNIAAADNKEEQQDLFDASRVGFDGGAWTAQTHLSEYGFNVDWGLMEVLEDACREIEDSHNDPYSKWYQYHQHGFLDNFWKPPKIVDAKVMEIGCGVGVYVDALKKEQAKKNRKVFGIEPNPMGGTFDRKRGRGPKQLAVNILDQGDTFEFGNKIRETELGGDYFDLIYSIEVFEHMPLDRHEDGARFMAGLAKEGTKLIFGASSPGQSGTGHIGNRKKSEWEDILKKVGFHKDATATQIAVSKMQEYNHKKNTQVYWFRGPKQ